MGSEEWGHPVRVPAPPLDPESHGAGSADFRSFGFQNRHFIESWCLNGGVTRTDPWEICVASCEGLRGQPLRRCLGPCTPVGTWPTGSRSLSPASHQQPPRSPGTKHTSQGTRPSSREPTAGATPGTSCRGQWSCLCPCKNCRHQAICTRGRMREVPGCVTFVRVWNHAACTACLGPSAGWPQSLPDGAPQGRPQPSRLLHTPTSPPTRSHTASHKWRHGM
uniref:Uncharacterized protein n=1 Tax=Molossus molossus TaxID=27622 RepID=A0A7J8HCF3_MOLMO|nr:hypothetical protein HJG59_011088 [Molossus molossus]